MIKNYLLSWKSIYMLKMRLSRKAFWSWAIMHVVAYVLLLAVYVVFTIDDVVGELPISRLSSRLATTIESIIFYGFFLAPLVLQMIRRLHDANRSAWWLLILFFTKFVSNFLKYPPIFIVGVLIISALLFMPSAEKNNTFFQTKETDQ